MRFTYTFDGYNQNIEITVQLEFPESVKGKPSLQRQLVTEKFVDFLNRYYMPDLNKLRAKFSELGPIQLWKFTVKEDDESSIYFQATINYHSGHDPVTSAGKLKHVAQQKFEEAITDLCKMSDLLKIIEQVK